MTPLLLTIYCGIGLIAVLFVGYVFSIFNGLIQLRNNIDKSWSNIDVLLKQRTDELPNLVSSVKGYMAHEQGALATITNARTAMMNAQTMGAKAQASDVISRALKTIFAVAENYPNLKANQNFLKLQQRITGLENEIADRRELYNDAVTNYNIRIESVPDTAIAGIMSLKRKELFKATSDSYYAETSAADSKRATTGLIVIIIALLLLVAAGVGIYFGVQLLSEKSTAGTVIENVSETSTAETQMTSTFANKFEWAEGLGCGNAYPNNDVIARSCLDEMYADIIKNNNIAMTFDQWLSTRPDLTTMNIDWQENRYADYLWSVKAALD